ncbi:MAG: C40 family peptidase [Lachnospiraceae bacterium]|nr:C40 family peptidase [Lachnospiraceae bacterium]
MRHGKLVFGACIAAACAVGASAILPIGAKNEDNNKKVENEVEEVTEASGTTTVLSSGVTYYLDKLSDQSEELNEVIGKVSFANAGITSILDSYGSSLSADAGASIQELDIATQFVPKDSIIAGYEKLGISNVTDYLNVRENPGTQNKVIGKMPGNCACEILEEVDGWYKIKSGDVEGYVCADYILTGYEANVKAMESMTTELYVNCSVLNVRQEPSTDCNVSTAVFEGEYLEILEELDGWYKVDINNLQGYVSADYVKKINTLPTAVKITEVVANTTYTNNNYGNNNYSNGGNSTTAVPNMTYTNLDSTVSQTAVDLINYGMQFLGNPYVYGGNSLTTGTDCSGFVKLIFAQFGYDLPRSSSAYLSTGYTIIPVSEAKPGDVFLYNYSGTIGHVGIYIGNGQLLHASTPSQGIKIGSAFYTQPYCALRVIP